MKMSDDSFAFDDSFNEILSQQVLNTETLLQNKDIFDKLFSNDFENNDVLLDLSINESLPQIILKFENYCNIDNNSTDSYFQYILGLTNLMQKLSQIEDKIIELWISSSKQSENCILSTVFKFLPNCLTKVCEPKAIDLSKFHKNLRMSFYESIAFNICQLMATLDRQHFHSVEVLLIRQLLSEENVCTILASDIICFVSRVSKLPLSYQFCSLLMTISSDINDSKLSNIMSVINRLIPFLKDIELEYLLKDYDLLTYSKVWRIPNIFTVLSTQQIKDCFNKINTFIENGNPLTKYNINILKYLLMTNELDSNSLNYCFELFWKNFIILNEPNLYIDFIEIMSVLLPNRLEYIFVEKIFKKFYHIFDSTKQNNKIAFNFDFTEKVFNFFIRLTFNETSPEIKEKIIQMISTYILFVYKNCDNFHTKYLVFKTLEVICLKSSVISVVDFCCKDQDFKEEFVIYLQKIKISQEMNESNKVYYLQHLETNLRNQEIKSNEMMIEENGSQSSHKIISEDFTQNQSNYEEIDGYIDSIRNNLHYLKQRRTDLNLTQKSNLLSLLTDFTEFSRVLKLNI